MMGVPNTTPLTPEQSELAAKNYKLAWDAFLNHRPRGVDDSDETLSAAFEGLILAARGYRPEMKLCFSTYAMYWMKREMQRAARQGVIHVPDYLLEDRECQSAKRFWAFARQARSIVSIHRPNREEGRAGTDIPAPSPDEDQDEQLEQLRIAIARLPDHQRQAVELVLEDSGLNEIARRFGITRQAVHARRKAAIQRLRKAMRRTGEHEIARIDRKEDQ